MSDDDYFDIGAWFLANEEGHSPSARKTTTGHWVAWCPCGCIDAEPGVTWFPESQRLEAVEEAYDLLELRKHGPGAP